MNSISHLRKPSGIILDCDGTLLSSMHAWHNLDVVFANELKRPLTKQETDFLNTCTLEESCAYLHHTLGVGLSPAHIAEMIQNYLLHFYEHDVEICPGADVFLRALQAAHIPAVVASSCPRAFLLAGLQRTGLLSLVQDVVSTDDVPGTKRDTPIYEHCLALLHSAPEACWAVDDSAYALAVMRDMGISTIGVHSCDKCSTKSLLEQVSVCVIDSLDDLTNCLSR